MNLLRTGLWLLYLILYLIVVCPTALYCKHLRKSGREEQAAEIIERVVHRWAIRIIKIAGGKVILRGEENIPEEPAVYIANHQSDFDIPIMLGYVGKPRSLMAKIELAKVPGVHLWMTLLDCIFLDRSDVKQSVRALMDGAKMVKSGKSITIFPEGTRSKGGPAGEFKGGAFKIATKARAPIVPVTIDGSYRLFEQRMRIHPGTVYVTIHPPIPTVGMTREEQNALPDKVRDIVLTTLQEDVG
ncbi:MAG: lysophospholipid acyltransferase family protein [Eubacteriales bacterium]|nr:lysophospholipid acyltransferase family protein [Eubacteriales bacterium]